MIMMPKYHMDTRLNVLREFDHAPSKLFIALGFDEDNQMKKFDAEEEVMIPRMN
jgi:hypothetical protein